jgi:hypothetical protein
MLLHPNHALKLRLHKIFLVLLYQLAEEPSEPHAACEREMKMAFFRNIPCWYQGCALALNSQEVNLPWFCEREEQDREVTLGYMLPLYLPL